MSSKKRLDHDGARVYELLNPKPKELLEKRRKLVRQGEVVMWSNNEKILKKRYLFLFEDVLLITKKEFTNSYWLKIFISLKPSIKASLFKDSKYKIPNVEFRVYCATTTFALFGKSREESETWVREINRGCGHVQSGESNTTQDTPKREQYSDSPKKQEPRDDDVPKRERFSDIQSYGKTGEKQTNTKLNIDDSLIPSQIFEISASQSGSEPPNYQDSFQHTSIQITTNQPQQQPNLFNPYQQQPQQQYPTQQPQQQYPPQQFSFTGNTSLFGSFPPQQQQPNLFVPQQQQPPQQQPNLFIPPQQQEPPQQQQQQQSFNPFLIQQQQPPQQQQQQFPAIVAFEQNGLKIVFEFPPKENEIILLNMKSTNANVIPITNFSLKMAAPSYVDLKMAVATGDVLQPQNSNVVEQKVKLVNTLQGIKPLVLKIKIDGQYGNELISLIHTITNLPENL